MNPVLEFIPGRLRRTRGTRRRPVVSVPALTLMAAEYDGATTSLLLTFDRPIDISALVGDRIVVEDMVLNEARFRVNSGVLETPVTLRAALGAFDLASEPGVHLTATAQTGIVAADDGGTWAGVSNVALPFGE